MKTVAVIPALNEEKRIAEVVRGARRYVDTVLVSDGGSTDRTIELAEEAGAKIYIGNTSLKRSYGANLKAGIKSALWHYNFDVIVILDGDGQHDTNDIPRLLEPIFKGRADAVMGCRIGQDGMPAYRLLGNRLLTTACNLGSRVRPPDAVVGFWAVRASAMPKLTERKWGICIEMLVKLRVADKRLVSVPIKPIYHGDYSDNSTLPPFKLGLLLLWAIAKWRIKCEVLHRWR